MEKRSEVLEARLYPITASVLTAPHSPDKRSANVDLACIPPSQVCTGGGCIHCPPTEKEEVEKRGEGLEARLDPITASVRAAPHSPDKRSANVDLACIPPSQVCTGGGCVHCPPTEKEEVEKRGEGLEGGLM